MRLHVVQHRIAFPAMACLLLAPTLAVAQRAVASSTGDEPQIVRVPFSDPARPGLLKISLVSGSITVQAHNDPDAVFEIASPGGSRAEHQRPAGAAGMHVIASNGVGFEVTEKDNVMVFDSPSWKRPVSIKVKVPVKTSLKLSSVNNGVIVVAGVDGDLELSNVNGRIEATDVSGSVVAETVNGGVKVTFQRVAPERFMAFSSLNGPIDVTFPPGVKADLYLDTDHGSIYSDFDIDVDRAPAKVSKSTAGGGTKIKVDNAVRGKLNGGGPEMRFKTLNGSIYIHSSAAR